MRGNARGWELGLGKCACGSRLNGSSVSGTTPWIQIIATIKHSLKTGRGSLSVGDACAAIILLEDGRYLLQLRDDIESIWYPGHWGCFGGAVGLGACFALLLNALRELWSEPGDFDDTTV